MGLYVPVETIRALVADPSCAGRIALRDVPAPTPSPSQAVVAVEAVSLNRGEVRALQGAADGWRPGWDLAGVVAEAAADGSGPPVGTPVVGLVGRGAWAERVAVETDLLARRPDGLERGGGGDPARRRAHRAAHHRAGRHGREQAGAGHRGERRRRAVRRAAGRPAGRRCHGPGLVGGAGPAAARSRGRHLRDRGPGRRLLRPRRRVGRGCRARRRPPVRGARRADRQLRELLGRADHLRRQPLLLAAGAPACTPSSSSASWPAAARAATTSDGWR